MGYSAIKIVRTFLILLTVSNLISCRTETGNLPYYDTPYFTPLFYVQHDAFARVKHKIGNFSFKDQHNNIVTEKNITGKIHVACFFFTSCGSICPKIINNMHKVDSAFSGNTDVLLLSYTVTPWIDSVKTLHTYAINQHIDNPNWHLLTGNKAEIYRLARTSYFAEEDLGYTKDSTQFLHTEHLLLVDKNKRIRGIYNGTLELEALQLIKDIKTLSAEK